MQPEVPCRHSNPFATCWTRPGAISFRFVDGESIESLVARLHAADGWGEIVGPHGSGKSTLLAAIEPELAAVGWDVARITLRDGQRYLPRWWLQAALSKKRPLVMIDGYEQLSWLSRALVKWRCHNAAAGLLVTSHEPTRPQTLYRTRVDAELAQSLVSTLTAERFSPITAADVAASHACHGSNLRELFFALYDRHEALSRTARTALNSSA
jgi:uncharacterized MnhB-related membrane protein